MRRCISKCRGAERGAEGVGAKRLGEGGARGAATGSGDLAAEHLLRRLGELALRRARRRLAPRALLVALGQRSAQRVGTPFRLPGEEATSNDSSNITHTLHNYIGHYHEGRFSNHKYHCITGHRESNTNHYRHPLVQF